MAKKSYNELKDLSIEEVETKEVLEKNGETVYYVPIEIEIRDQLVTLGITEKQCRTWRIGTELKTVHLSPCDKETFTLLSRDLRAQQIKGYRNTRCMVPGKLKPLVRCPEKYKCAECPFGISVWNRKPNIVSLDELMERRREPSGNESVDQLVSQRMDLQEIKAAMDEKDSRLFQIFVLMNLLDYNKSEIARKFQISRNSVYQLIDEMNDIIQQFRNARQ